MTWSLTDGALRTHRIEKPAPASQNGCNLARLPDPGIGLD